jgi:hypothetical protein
MPSEYAARVLDFNVHVPVGTVLKYTPRLRLIESGCSQMKESHIHLIIEALVTIEAKAAD